MEKSELARAYFLKGYNCAQSVTLAFAPELGMEEAAVAQMMSGFGGGMGRMREVCGAVSGMVHVLGTLRGYSDPHDPAAKTACYALIQRAMERYRAENGSYICRELLGLDKPEGTPVAEERTAQYYAKRPCADLVACAASITADLLAETQGEDQ